MCTVLVIALAMFGTGALAKPGYAAGYAVDYYVSVSTMKLVVQISDLRIYTARIVKDFFYLLFLIITEKCN